MALFRVDFSGRGELSERQQKVMDSKTFPRHTLLTSTLAARSGAVFGRRCTVVT
jgi:hypothetical protein